MAIITLKQSQQLLEGDLPDGQVSSLMGPVGFADQAAAVSRLQHLGTPETRAALAACLPHLLAALSEATLPDHVLVNVERLAHNVAEPKALFSQFAQMPRTIETLVTLFAGSQFLTEILLRHPEYVECLADPAMLAQAKTLDAFCDDARAVTEQSDPDGVLDALRRWQRWELLRIGACDLKNLLGLAVVTEQLSHLADSLIRVCLSLYQTPDQPFAGFTVIAMGKLGGQELNYSSDIDLLFLAPDNASSYEPLGRRLVDALSRMSAEGFLYRVDMRLRPWGRSGPLVSSLDGYLNYLRDHAQLWERQALLKARVIVGEDIGAAFAHGVRPLLLATPPEDVRAQVHGMKQRTESRLRARGRSWGQVKLGEGSIRDVEFITQYLQLINGATTPDILCRTTLKALDRLQQAALLRAEEHRVLVDGYTFLRTIEHHLQMMHYQQTHVLPNDPDELAFLAKRLGFAQAKGQAQFLERFEEHRQAIRAVYNTYLQPATEAATRNPPDVPSTGVDAGTRRHLTRMHDNYAQTFSRAEIAKHATMAAGLGNESLVSVDADAQEDGVWQITLVGYDYFGELSLICGLFVVHEIDILDGHAFTYEPSTSAGDAPALQPSRPAQRRRFRLGGRRSLETRPKIVDVFRVRALHGQLSQQIWADYATELGAFLKQMQQGKRSQVQGQLALQVAQTLKATTSVELKLSPVHIEIDNHSSQQYTVLRINSPDTQGFLYELTNALSLNRVYIRRVEVETAGSRVCDTLYVTDERRKKITAQNKLQQLRAATVLVKHFTHLLPHAPDPASALLHFREFLDQTFSRPGWTQELTSLERPEVLDALARLLGISDFLWDDFLRMQHANLFPLLSYDDALAQPKPQETLNAELSAQLDQAQATQSAVAALNTFKDKEMFRIDMRYILGHIEQFERFSGELTELAEVVVGAAYALCNNALVAEYGTPGLDGSGTCPLSICALGKFGGRELGFASDIELMFIYAGNGTTSGPNKITTAEYFEKLTAAFVQTIQSRREGIFEVDLQLRPYGKAGSMAVPLDAFGQYFNESGPAWAYERQALVKLRPVAGDEAFCKQVVALRDALIYTETPFDISLMRAMRERQVRHLVTAGTFNAKFSPGGLVDLEYLVQGLQITHGRRHPPLRQPNTLAALEILRQLGVLTHEHNVQLREAYAFLRELIEALRVVRGNAKDLHVPSPDSDEFTFLARRLAYEGHVQPLRDHLYQYTLAVQELSGRLLA